MLEAQTETPQNWVHRFWGCLTVPVPADMRLEEARPSTSPLQRGRGPRFLVRLAPRAPALTAGSGDLPRARRDSRRPALLDRQRGPTPVLELFRTARRALFG